MQKINNSFKVLEDLTTFLDITIELKSEDYKSERISKVIFGYYIIPMNELKDSNPKVGLRSLPSLGDVRSFEFKGFDLPASMDYSYWGNVVLDTDSVASVLHNKYVYQIQKSVSEGLLQHKVEVYVDSLLVMEWTDTQSERFNLDSFTRKLKDQEYRFVEGTLVVKTLARKAKFLSPIKGDKRLNKKFITFDLETYFVRSRDGSMMIPYCICYYVGYSKELKSFYLTDFSSVDHMMRTAFESLFVKRFHNHKVYIHNLSQFDGVFLLKYLSQIDGLDIKPVMRSGKIIQLNCRLSGINLAFRDSLLMLPASLGSLCESFGVEVSKDIFPYDFVTPDRLGYSGAVPSYTYFNKDKVSKQEYQNYASDFSGRAWDMRAVTIDYCSKDCISLCQVLTKFNSLIFERYGIDPAQSTTIPSLTFRIFRSRYLGDAKIPLIVGNMYTDIKSGYTGGATDMYIPYGENVHEYDVNSLYPSAMAKYKMPVGHPKYFVGDIFSVNPDAFGFFNVEVTAPDENRIANPIVQTKVKTSGGVRTVSPIGTWTDCMFSEEIKNAVSYGYSFRVKSGYLFEAENIFEPFVLDVFQLKATSAVGSALYLIAKLLMNSLYGRFGMDPMAPDHAIVEVGELQSIQASADITELAQFDSSNKVLIAIKDVSRLERDTSLLDADTNVSVPIAAAVTAYGRIEMSPYKEAGLLYTDTDSAFLAHPLPDPLVSDTELGKFKLVAVFKKAVFLAPKVYGGILASGKEIVKVKGSKVKVPFRVLKSLLYRDSKYRLSQTKWFRDWSKGHITVRDQLYTLTATNNKRRLVYSGNKLIGTAPYKIDNNKSIKSRSNTRLQRRKTSRKNRS